MRSSEAPAGILTLMAGGQASEDTQKILAQEGVGGLVRSLEWLKPGDAEVAAQPPCDVGARFVVPRRLRLFRSWASIRPGVHGWPVLTGGMLFAGEHTSIKWQGYMNGAVESGLRAAAEVLALAAVRAIRLRFI